MSKYLFHEKNAIKCYYDFLFVLFNVHVFVITSLLSLFGTYCGFWKKVFHRAPANPWIRAQQNLQKEMWVLWRVRSACTAASRCRFGSLATHRTNVNTLIRLHGCTGWSKSAGHTCNFLSDRLCSGSDCRAMESSSDMLHNKHWWEQNGCAFYAISLVSSPGLHQAGRV